MMFASSERARGTHRRICRHVAAAVTAWGILVETKAPTTDEKRYN